MALIYIINTDTQQITQIDDADFLAIQAAKQKTGQIYNWQKATKSQITIYENQLEQQQINTDAEKLANYKQLALNSVKQSTNNKINLGIVYKNCIITSIADVLAITWCIQNTVPWFKTTNSLGVQLQDNDIGLINQAVILAGTSIYQALSIAQIAINNATTTNEVDIAVSNFNTAIA